MTVDTLSLAKELRAAELSSTQAEAIAAAIGRSVSEGSATKADIQLLRGELDQTKLELRAEIEKVRSTLVMWFVATNLTMAAVIVAVVKL